MTSLETPQGSNIAVSGQLNKIVPLWMREPNDIAHEEYVSCYKSLSSDEEEHLFVKHFTVAGQLGLKALLFVPRRSPSGVLGQHQNGKRGNIKLLFQNTLLMDNCSELVPEWLWFAHGLVDVEYPPLEFPVTAPEQNKMIRVIKRILVKKCLEMLMEKRESEQYKIFYEQYSQNLKLGIKEDHCNRAKIGELLQLITSKSGEHQISLKEYVDRMKKDQDLIYYVVGENVASMSSSPFVKNLDEIGLEVLYLIDPLDEHVIQLLKEFNGKRFKSVQDHHQEQDLKEAKAEFDFLTKSMKDILGDMVGKVLVSECIIDSACIVGTSEHGWQASMDRIMRAQAFRDSSTSEMSSYYQYIKQFKRDMWINPQHATIVELKEKTAFGRCNDEVADFVWLLFDISCHVLMGRSYVEVCF
eukprot:gnl/MRDRNA2_/MRDRNA2_76485_c0_seq1.p1 gnl/MRDRNA2_/MRDRNA2_76485_c0~~gnl/MRDRNA2_/MRDRNA2_76485_c0_seq1.p1  ORF type:complete len:413 (+),score=73.28 gnl/MRDRNA2_/MRDRNA2_76485_c0_seq1:45-1283(+)